MSFNNEKTRDDLINQYKLTIQELTEKNESLKNEISNLKYENKKINKEMESFKEKTIDKIKDLEFLNIQYEKLKKDNEKLKEDLNQKGTNNSNSSIIIELKNKLNSTLEENINLQTDYENYKNLTEQALLKKENEIDELKNDLHSKEKMISQITKHRDFLLTTLYNAQDGQPNVGTNLTKYNSMQIFKAENKKIPDNFVALYSKSFLDNLNNISIDEGNNKPLLSIQSKEEFSFNKGGYKNYNESKGNLLSLNNNTNGSGDNDDEKDFLQKKLAMELTNILEERRNYIINTMMTENFAFDIISNERCGSRSSNKLQEMKLIKNIDEILVKIQQKKEKMIKHKNFLMTKYEKKE